MTLSRVGFNQDQTQALVYIGNQEGPLSGAGYIVLLNKQFGNWELKQKIMVWIS